MSYSAQRVIRQGIPLAVLILSIGLARQYAAGAGVFEAGNELMAKAQAVFTQLRSDFLPETTLESEPSAEPEIAAQPAVSSNALENVLADQPRVDSFQPTQFSGRGIGFSHHPPATCRH